MALSREAQLFLQLVSIPVESRNERAMADRLRAELERLGCAVEEDNAGAKLGGNAGNLVARLPASPGLEAAGPVILSAHMDRVANHGHILAIVDEARDRITSDGTSILGADDAAGLVAVLGGLRRLRETGEPHGPIEVVFSVCEEAGVLGAAELDFSALRSRMAFVFDGGETLEDITTSAPGTTDFFITVHGKKAHAGSSPEKGLNAIRVAAEAICAIPDGRLAADLTANFGILQAGTDTNVVCDRAVISGEARSPKRELLKGYLEKLEQTMAETAARWKTTIDVRLWPIYEPYEVPASAPVVGVLKRALARMGLEGRCKRAGGGSDANHFNAHGIEAVCIGIGQGGCHTNSEWQSISALPGLSELVLEIVREARDFRG